VKPKNILQGLIILFIVSACTNSKEKADHIIYNAVVYTVDSAFSIQQAIAIKNGAILACGSTEQILHSFEADEKTDAGGRFIYPGFIDAHCHFYGYGKGLSQIELTGTRSYKEVIENTYRFYKNSFLDKMPETNTMQQNWLIGRGWDQNDWDVKEFPHRFNLDSLFPTTPVFLKRIDGHAALVNKVVLDLAGFTAKTKIAGGELIVQNNELTGVLIDNAVDSVEKLMPAFTKEFIKKALLRAQENCLQMGITTVVDAGLEKEIVDIIDQLQQSGELAMSVYAMLSPSAENLDYFLKKGNYKTDRLNVRSFKFYADGALGSRGACLCHEYTDKKNWKGFLLNDIAYYEKYAALMAEKGFQMNTHCIGDSAARVILSIYNKYCKEGSDLRWRIEHAQVIHENDFTMFNRDIIPSVQPTHATSDMYWAKDRLGETRVHNAYAYKKLLSNSGILALGTDFPVEDISPFKTFYAAVFRKDENGWPEKGFQTMEALSREESLRGITIWAAYANFEEHEKGSLEKGKWADFVLLDKDLMKCNESEVLKTKVLKTYIHGKNMLNSAKKVN